MIKHCLPLLALILMSGSALAQNTAGTETAIAQPVIYLTELGDIPLMPGLNPIEDSAFMFDKPAGRIVEAYYTTEVNKDDIVAFYDTNLPPLGWNKAGTDSFVREQEQLSIEIDQNTKGKMIISFMLEPVDNGESATQAATENE